MDGWNFEWLAFFRTCMLHALLIINAVIGHYLRKRSAFNKCAI